MRDVVANHQMPVTDRPAELHVDVLVGEVASRRVPPGDRRPDDRRGRDQRCEGNARPRERSHRQLCLGARKLEGRDHDVIGCREGTGRERLLREIVVIGVATARYGDFVAEWWSRLRKTSTTSGSKCSPAFTLISCCASSIVRRIPIGLVVRHRVERVDDREDPGGQRDLDTAKPARIPGAVPALVVAGDHLTRETAELRNRRDDALAEPRMLADLVQLCRRECAGLEQRRVGDADHPDVVQPEAVRELGLEGELGRDVLREVQRELRHAGGVRGRLSEATAPVVVQLERAGERLNCCCGRLQLRGCLLQSFCHVLLSREIVGNGGFVNRPFAGFQTQGRKPAFAHVSDRRPEVLSDPGFERSRNCP